MMSHSAICASEAPTMPASFARAKVSGPRPSSKVRTSSPLTVSRLATALPIMPGAMTATIGCMVCSCSGGSLNTTGFKIPGYIPDQDRGRVNRVLSRENLREPADRAEHPLLLQSRPLHAHDKVVDAQGFMPAGDFFLN